MEQVIKNKAKTVAEKLLQINAIKLRPEQPFTWASGWKSPIYCDNRILLSHPEIRELVVEAMVEKSKSFDDFSMVAGVATAGIAHGALLAAALKKPFIYVRSKAKEHGRQNLIEGEVHGDEKVLVVEDLISTGGSCLMAVDALRRAGCDVSGVLAIFTYGFPQAEQAFADAACTFKTLTDYNILLQQAVEAKYIEESQMQHLTNWRKAPESWSAE